MILTPFNYTGSKHKLLPQLIPLFDHTKPYFLDLFCGGGSVYTNVLPIYERVWANDIIADLIGAHESLIDDPDFVSRIKALCVSKDDQAGYHRLRDFYNAQPTPEGLYALMLCCTNNMMRFNQSFKFNQTFGKRTFNESTQAKIDEFVAHVRPLRAKLVFTSREFDECWPSEPAKTFAYIDPPYGSSSTEAGYNAYWSEAHETRLYDYIKRFDATGGSFALSGIRGEHKGNKEATLITRLIADGYHVHDIQHDYSKVARNKDAKRGQEVLITNYS
jgi:DNA adenine methylase Dam